MSDANACALCGEPISSRSALARYCSNKCAKKSERQRAFLRAGPLPKPRVCRVCGDDLSPGVTSFCGSGCSLAYEQWRWARRKERLRAEHGDPWLPRPCADCGVVFAQDERCGKPWRTCETCRAEPTNFRATAEPRECECCGQSFKPMVGKQRFCSNRCNRKAPERNDAIKERRRIRVAERKAAGLCPDHGNEKPCTPCWVKQQRKRQRRQATLVEYVDIRVVAESQRWKCSQCGKAIPKSAKWPDPKSLSMDHTVPVSEGGETSYRNVTAAHLECNVAKGAKALVPEQLRLVG